MSTRPIRRGLPRVPGGDFWPPAGEAPIVAPAADAEPAPVAEPMPVVANGPGDVVAGPIGGTPAALQAMPEDRGTAGLAPSAPNLRRGLPRTLGAEPWPPADSAPLSAASASRTARETAPSVTAPVDAAPVDAQRYSSTDVPAPSATDGMASARRGMPRTAGGDQMPPAGPARTAPSAAVSGPVLVSSGTAHVSDESTQAEAPAPGPSAIARPRRGLARPGGAQGTASRSAPPTTSKAAASTPAPETASGAGVGTIRPPREPLPFTPTVWPGAAASIPREPKSEPQRMGPFTRLQWVGAVIVGGAALLVAAAMAVLAVRFMLSTEPLRDFLAIYPGEYHLPEGAPVGFPAWLNWAHFLNTFFILLIIRSGLQVRREKRPGAFWTPRWNSSRKISLSLWFHQSLDILWLVNGLVFVVLLFVSGQWIRIVPTSWEVFPNAVSAVLQYISLDWPTENGWVNYNAVQQIAYFTTVFIAAPLAVVTGVRMSGIWPSRAKALNRIYPVEWARAVHFPVMLYFVIFIAIHVFLVFATGALRNLNHMYAAQGSPDPDAFAGNWAGFWWFVASLFVIAAAWVAARPLVLAPIAGLFGTVKGR